MKSFIAIVVLLFPLVDIVTAEEIYLNDFRGDLAKEAQKNGLMVYQHNALVEKVVWEKAKGSDKAKIYNVTVIINADTIFTVICKRYDLQSAYLIKLGAHDKIEWYVQINSNKYEEKDINKSRNKPPMERLKMRGQTRILDARITKSWPGPNINIDKNTTLVMLVVGR